jgi:2-hydroxychromene-2-carboxylate isomerase
MSVVVYGDFNCPFSYLASRRVDVLVKAGLDVAWRAVQHAPGLPVTGQRLDAAGQAEMNAEVGLVRQSLLPDEELPVGALSLLPRTEAAVSAYAEAVGAGVGDEVRRLLFDAYWLRSVDIGSPEVLRTLLANAMRSGHSASFTVRESGYAVSTNRGPITLAAYRRISAWHCAWNELGTQTTPTLVVGRQVLAGNDALRWLVSEPGRAAASAAA